MLIWMYEIYVCQKIYIFYYYYYYYLREDNNLSTWITGCNTPEGPLKAKKSK